MKAYNSNGVSPGINNDENDDYSDRNGTTRRLNFLKLIFVLFLQKVNL